MFEKPVFRISLTCVALIVQHTDVGKTAEYKSVTEKSKSYFLFRRSSLRKLQTSSCTILHFAN